MVESLFRLTNTGDTISTIAATEIIQFNLTSSTKPDGTASLTSPSFRMTRDLNFHPNPRKALDPVQDSLLGLVDVTVTGYFLNHLNTLGPRNLFNWSVGEGDTDDFSFGRFGMDLSSFDGILSLTPTSTTGYYLYDIDVEDVEDPRDEIPFVAKFYRSGTISEIT